MNLHGGAAAQRALTELVRSWRPWAILVLLCAALYLPGSATIPPLDRDEARFMQASRQMLESGDFLRIRFQDDARNKKPAGIYWLQAASVALLSTPASNAPFPYRLPSLLGATGAVLLTFWLGQRLVGRAAALLGAALLASAVLLVVEAHLAKTDAVLLLTIVAAQGTLGTIYRAEREEESSGSGIALLFWLAQGIGILVKGPVTPLVSALTLVALSLADGDWHWLARLRPQWGMPLAAAIVLPWLFAIQSATQGAFANEALGHDLWGKLIGAQEAHGAPPGTYLLLLPVTFWPSSALLAAGLVAGWRRRHETTERFLLAWLVPGWLLFELVPTKLPHYVLPLYPALALLAGGALATPLWLPLRNRTAETINLAFWAAIGLALCAGLVWAPAALDGGAKLGALVPILAFIAGGMLLMRRAAAGLDAGAVAMLALVAVLVLAPSFALLLPQLDGLWLSRSAAALIAAQPARNAIIETVGYNEPSLVFLLGGRTRAASAAQAAEDLARGGTALALIASPDESAFAAALAERGAQARKLGTVSGINYSRSSRRISLALYAAGEGG